MVGENGFLTAGYVDAGLKLVESLGLYLILVSFTSSRAVPLSVFVFQATRCYSPFLSLSLSPLFVSTRRRSRCSGRTVEIWLESTDLTGITSTSWMECVFGLRSLPLFFSALCTFQLTSLHPVSFLC